MAQRISMTLFIQSSPNLRTCTKKNFNVYYLLTRMSPQLKTTLISFCIQQPGETCTHRTCLNCDIFTDTMQCICNCIYDKQVFKWENISALRPAAESLYLCILLWLKTTLFTQYKTSHTLNFTMSKQVVTIQWCLVRLVKFHPNHHLALFDSSDVRNV